jgi:endonuclease/exonuclease/phosphatase family metal-dependent hydrolase
MRVLTWNLFHGRSQPPAGTDLQAYFAAALASWAWDAALLQEVPPWWPAPLALACEAEHRDVLTSRNAGLWLRRAIAVRWPDAIKSNAGGCNAVLARVPIIEHRTLRLRIVPERRVAQLVRLQDRTCLVNFHASAREPLAEQELAVLWERAIAFSNGAPLVLGGDLNLRQPSPQFDDVEHVASRDVDHVFARRLMRRAPALRLDRKVAVGARTVELSDHVPLMAELWTPPAPGVAAKARI